jgi:6-phosphogluconolactonase (cycloisomerase 2 family)
MATRVARPDILPSFRLWTGCYTADGHGSGLGIGTIRVENGIPTWSGLAAETPSPSFLARHPSRPVLYAVGEMAQTVSAFRIDGPGMLSPLGPIQKAGAAVCHVALAPQGRFLVACCWGDGQVLCYPLREDGSILPPHRAPDARDPHERKDSTSRAHCALMLDDGRIATTDLGFDLVRVWRYEHGRGLVADHEVVLPAESEPRHLVQHPSGRILVIGEASVTVFVLARAQNGRFGLESATPALTAVRKGDTASEISLDATGRFALVGVRGQNTIVTLSVSGDGSHVEPISSAPCGGTTPRHHLQIGQALLVANQGSDTVTGFRLARHTGTIVEQVAEINVGTPSCLLAA